MNAKDLELKISGLEKAIATCKDETSGYENSLKVTQKQLVDYNKPELEPVVFDQITEAIESVLGDFDFNDVDNYQDLEYELDYDGRVSLSNIGFDPYDLQEKVCNAVYELFKEADAPEDEPTADQLNTQTVAEKVI